MPSLISEKHKLMLNNAKNVSRNNIRDLSNSNTLTAPKNDMSFMQKDTSPSNLKLHMLSFERQPLNMLIDKSVGKLVSQDTKNKMLAKLLKKHNNKKNKEKTALLADTKNEASFNKENQIVEKKLEKQNSGNLHKQSDKVKKPKKSKNNIN
jgi:hypothetical protein